MITIKTLIINGSPRKNGDTVSLINKVTENLSGEIKVVNTYYDNISPCTDCRYCWKNKGCCIDDEMQSVYEYLIDSDNVLIASPVYFSEVTGRMLDFASRLQTYYCAKFKRHQEKGLCDKKGAVILVGGGDGSIEKAYDTAVCILKCMNVKDVFSLVSSHNTDNISAKDDIRAITDAKGIAEYFNICAM